MRKIALAFASMLAGYAAGALLGAAAVQLLSGNTHDRSVEAAMTAAFVTGPLGAALSLIVYLIVSFARRR